MTFLLSLVFTNCHFSDTSRHDIEEAFRGFLKRDDIAIILINQTVCTVMCNFTHYSKYFISIYILKYLNKSRVKFIVNKFFDLRNMICLLQIAEEIRYVIDSHDQPIPAVLEIPSKDSPYDSSKDSILRRAKVRSL